MNDQLTKIQLSDTEAKLFMQFRKHQSLFELLESIKAFDTRSGSITIHFNADGKIAGVAKEEHFTNKVFHT